VKPRLMDGRVRRWLHRCRWLSGQPFLAAIVQELTARFTGAQPAGECRLAARPGASGA